MVLRLPRYAVVHGEKAVGVEAGVHGGNAVGVDGV